MKSIIKPISVRTTFLLSLLLILGLSVTAQNKAQSDNLGILSFESETIDYGTIKQKADGIAVFKFKNTGNSAIVITDVKTSCGCTVASAPETAILPGESSQIEVNYDTKKLGTFSKSITVLSNAAEGRKVLKIKGEVVKNPSR
ncbi:MAG: DUF1573 domain-containing protein [Bacteroidia bacterium]|nr:DUF1573 domain-containing protein [Bacteroidia bacterium]NND50870.1 DUF1573 domain-containing protein [Flavobacteriaceae bacterium]